MFVEPLLGIRPWLTAELWGTGLEGLLGEKALNTIKREEKGNFGTRAILWGLEVGADLETVSLPHEKREEATQLANDAICDPGTIRIPIQKIQKLRGSMEHWQLDVPALKPELRAVDRMSRERHGIDMPGWNRRESNNAFQEFWKSADAIRAILASTEECANPFTAHFDLILKPEEALSLARS